MQPEMESEVPPEVASEPVKTSLVQRLANAFVAPGEVFDEVKASPLSHANWYVPMLLSFIVAIVFVQVAFSQPTVLREMRDAQAAKIQAKVDAGAMSQKDADNTIDRINSFMKPGMIKIFGSISAVFGTVLMFCFLAFLLWLVGKWPLRRSLSYGKAMEIVGIATMINVLGAIVMVFLVMLKGSLYVSVGPALLIKHIEPSNNLHQALMALNLFQFWFMSVLSIGLAKVSSASTGLCAALIFGVWAAYKIVTILLF